MPGKHRQPAGIAAALLAPLILAGFLALAAAPPALAVVVSTAQELAQAVADANRGGDKLIQLADGVYQLDDMLWLEADGVTVEGLSGRRGAVVIQGRGMDGAVTHVFNLAGSDFTVRHLSMGLVSQHALQTQPAAQAPTVYDVRLFDTGEQMLKVAWNPAQPEAHTDRGLVENCLFEYTAEFGPQYYIGGVDCHRGEGWVVRGNVFRNIKSPETSPAEHAIHFWSWARGTLIENNVIINCDRGIGLGLGERGHADGVVRNNMIYHRADDAGAADVGIGLESAPGSWVYHNTVLLDSGYPHAIEYRFAQTSDARIFNNLTNRAIASRDGGAAELSHNLAGARAGWFRDPAAGDLHLASPVAEVVDRGHGLEGLTTGGGLQDIDGDLRPQGAAPDLGADEYGER
jgi:hypothetical protein